MQKITTYLITNIFNDMQKITVYNLYCDKYESIDPELNFHSSCRNCKNRESCEIKSFGSCKVCGYLLNPIYVEIIRKLKNSGLLPQNYELRCCFHANNQK